MARQTRSTVLAAGALALACGTPADRPEAAARDGESASVGAPAERIVSLMPAATEILFALDAGGRLVGRTRWGIHPPAARAVPDVGDGMRPSLEAILTRDPDLVLLYDGAGNEGVADRLAGLGVPALALAHDTFADLERNVLALGRVSGCEAGAERLRAWISDGLRRVTEAVASAPRLRVYYDVWAEPPITIGRGSFLDSLLAVAGAENIFGDRPEPAPPVGIEAIVDRDPDWILTAAAPDSVDVDPGLGMRPGWDRIEAVREGRIGVVDRDLVGRLGPRAAEAARAVALALRPDLELPPPEPWVPSCAG